jgi:hypothetical protein
MNMDPKDRKAEIDRLTNELAKSTAPEAEWLRKLLDLHFEDAKERLVTAQEVEFQRIQGEARYTEKFSRQLTAASALLRSNREPIR